MQAKNLTGGQELLCINTEKVYDWIINDVTFDLSLDDLDLPTVDEELIFTCDDIGPAIDQYTITCEVEPTTGEEGELPPFVVISRETQEFDIDGTLVDLQIVTIQKNFEVTIFATPNAGGAPVEVGSEVFSRFEQVILCAPEGTDIDLTYSQLDCFVTALDCDDVADTLDVDVTVRLCQSIQSTFPVTLELVAEFCQPREELPVGPCPTPSMPDQCPVLFPVTGDGE